MNQETQQTDPESSGEEESYPGASSEGLAKTADLPIPSMGRIVFVQTTDDSDDLAPALITKVHSNDCINVTLFPDSQVPHPMTSVMYGRGEHLWHWPPRV